MESRIEEIKNYILYLKKNVGLHITLHPRGSEQLITSSELIAFNIHDHPHCLYVKTFTEAHEHCINRQYKITEKCKNGSFCGTCYAGVFEFVYPLSDGENIAGFLCVGSYRPKNCISYIKRCAEKYAVSLKNLERTVSNLMPPPDKTEIDTLIFPLIRMIELAYIQFDTPKEVSALSEKVLRYVNRHYAEKTTLQDICKKFSCSRSAVSHTFKKTVGKSFREYLITKRLQTAKLLLAHSGLSINEISASVGFSDSNYFSSVFKKSVGISPRTYRNKSRAGT